MRSRAQYGFNRGLRPSATKCVSGKGEWETGVERCIGRARETSYSNSYSIANTHIDSNPETVAYTDSNSDPKTIANANSNCYSDCDGNSDCHGNSHTHSYSNPYSHGGCACLARRD